MSVIEEFAQKRRLLQDFCTRHYPSVEYFNAGLSFAIYKSEIANREITPNSIRHLTSTVTCYESLFECPERFRPSGKRDFKSYAAKYSERVISLSAGRWKSDGSARIYCRCRTLPLVMQHIPQWHANISDHVEAIFSQMTDFSARRFAIEEANPDENQKYWYPPNAYHTYWALKVLEVLQTTFPAEYQRLNAKLQLDNKSYFMREWARKSLAEQVSLPCAHSSILDSDQLAWALAIVCRSPTNFEASLREQDFLRQAFSCLFGTQTDVGSWRHYGPLFHYQKTGNAYCYVFETFATILQCALRQRAEFIRAVLQEHSDKLMKLWQYACSTQIQIDELGRPVVWSSGHRTNNTESESWATASVFSYAQALRRLLGIWTRDLALAALPKRGIYYSSKQAAQESLSHRTKTWTKGSGLSDRMWAMFVNPNKDANPLEPDNQPIGENYARSAILYGPPGASKTTIVRALAGVIGWDYVELHASHFVADGLPNVQRTADEIFRRLMELDRTIVLFDEIDELVRERQGQGSSDSFGRFLTTSMLPKLAELWESRKVMYFVATNHIELFDRAITRSQRFDAVIFVSPPSFDSKVRQLKDLFLQYFGKEITLRFSQADIDAAMPRIDDVKDGTDLSKLPLDSAHMLAKFALLRWDELAELAIRIDEVAKGRHEIDSKLLSTALERLRDGRWRTLREYADYQRDQDYERQDCNKLHVWIVDGLRPRELSKLVGTVNGVRSLETPVADASQVQIKGYHVTGLGNGKLHLEKR